jgi:hypothetical protein
MFAPLALGISTWFLKAARFFGTEQNKKNMRRALLKAGILTSAIWAVTIPPALKDNGWKQVLAVRPVSASQLSRLLPTPEAKIIVYDWQRLHDDGKLLGGTPLKMDGRTVLKIENTNEAPLQVTLFRIEKPPIASATYAILGEIRYENVQGNAYLEMWNYFPPVSSGLPEGQYFSRTLGEAGSGPVGRISGTSSWRPFSLTFDRSGTTNLPTRLEINIFLPARGVVWLGSPRLMR